MSKRPRFHLAFPVTDLEAAREFYQDVLGCTLGRESGDWIDFNLFGHQIVAHRVDEMPRVPTNKVYGEDVPACHFGLLLGRSEWNALKDRLVAQNIDFLIEPHVRFEGEAGEQATLFISDPSGNGLEFKSFANEADIFDRGI